MNRKEFLQKLFTMYPNTFTTGENGNGKVWREAYEKVLKEKWDYDTLFFKFIEKYPHTHIAPAPSFFMEFVMAVEPTKKAEAVNSAELLKKEYIEPLDDETRNKIEEAVQKLKTGTDNRNRTMIYGGKYD